MSAFNKVLEKIQRNPLNGHALRNIENNKSLAKAKREIENMIKGKL